LVFEGEDVDVGGLHEFFLDAGGGEVDEVAVGVVVSVSFSFNA
jgi:hypothetical protein